MQIFPSIYRLWCVNFCYFCMCKRRKIKFNLKKMLLTIVMNVLFNFWVCFGKGKLMRKQDKLAKWIMNGFSCFLRVICSMCLWNREIDLDRDFLCMSCVCVCAYAWNCQRTNIISYIAITKEKYIFSVQLETTLIVILIL